MNKDWSPAQVLELRRLHRLSQRELGEFCDVSVSTVSRWETGNAAPDRRSAVALTRIKIGEIRLGARCLWCGTLHGRHIPTPPPTAIGRPARSQRRVFRQRQRPRRRIRS